MLVSGQLLVLAPYPESLGVADTGSTSEMNTVVAETPVLVATVGVTVKVRGAVECSEAADPFPGVPVSMSDNVDAWLGVGFPIEGLGTLPCPQLLAPDVCLV